MIQFQYTGQKDQKKLPVVFTKSEAIEVLGKLKGTHWLERSYMVQG